MKKEVRITMLLMLTMLALSCSKIHLKPSKPQAGERVIIVSELKLHDPILEVILFKENVDFEYFAVKGKKEKDFWVFGIQTDTITSYVLWRIVDGDSVFFEDGNGLIVFYGNKPMRLAYYYKGLHAEKAIPYAFPVSDKEKDRLISRALRYYKKELKYHPGEPLAFGRMKAIKAFLIKDEKKKARYLYELEKEIDSLFETKNLYATLSAFNVAYLFDFSRTYDYFKVLSEQPYLPGILDASLNYLYQYARSLGPQQGVKWLEVGLEKYREFLEEPSTKLKNTLRNYYLSLHYGYMALGDTLKALDCLWKLRDLNPFDPEPYMVEASVRMAMGTLNYRTVDSLLYIAGNLFHPVANCYNFPFYPKDQRIERLKRKKLGYYRIMAKYYENAGEVDSAIASMRQIIELQGGDLMADYGDHENLGSLLLSKGDVSGAVNAFANAVVTGSEWGYLKESITNDLKKRGFSQDSIEKIITEIESKYKEVRIKAPEVTLITLDGKQVKLSDYKGKVVVLNFWATWCGPCRREIPDLNKLVDEYIENKDIVFVAITNDKRERVLNFLGTNEFKYMITFDPGNAYEKYNVMAVPTHVIIGKDGYIHARIVGSLPQMDQILKEKIESAVK
ncbi:MAG: redoxin domain-containing protein [candidate division WOR-3 bacterium]